ncbi:MAG: hypothetical protein ABW321_17610 [Polyangiales bacterium]
MHSAAPTPFRRGRLIGPWQEQGWQDLWFSTQVVARPWRTLAILPASPGLHPDLVTQIAIALARAGMTHGGEPIHVADASRVTQADLGSFSQEVVSCTRNLSRVLIALAPIDINPTTVALAQASDAALLCVLRGLTQVRHARRTVREVGKRHFVGSTLFDPPR